jgi:hypothetical protein
MADIAIPSFGYKRIAIRGRCGGVPDQRMNLAGARPCVHQLSYGYPRGWRDPFSA